ncbi:unnamed protein product [Anisakis simplex]|uniref:Phage protein n=1 Tax=Anisakis simplex TaxID=6269 RepID=A0A0M3J436_ANISI|nr:unnamed protein product [Anisakis simplex]
MFVFLGETERWNRLATVVISSLFDWGERLPQEGGEKKEVTVTASRQDVAGTIYNAYPDGQNGQQPCKKVNM